MQHHAPDSTDPSITIPITIPRSLATVIAAPCEYVSQHNSFDVLGLPRRPYLEVTRAFARAGGQVVHSGKLRLVRREEIVAYLASLAAPTAAPASGADAVLAGLGRVRAAK